MNLARIAPLSIFAGALILFLLIDDQKEIRELIFTRNKLNPFQRIAEKICIERQKLNLRSPAAPTLAHHAEVHHEGRVALIFFFLRENNFQDILGKSIFDFKKYFFALRSRFW